MKVISITRKFFHWALNRPSNKNISIVSLREYSQLFEDFLLEEMIGINWIPITDRTPSMPFPILVLQEFFTNEGEYKNNFHIAVYYSKCGELEKGEFHSYDTNELILDVTFWKNLDYPEIDKIC
jgi:hypothetical protein